MLDSYSHLGVKDVKWKYLNIIICHMKCPKIVIIDHNLDKTPNSITGFITVVQAIIIGIFIRHTESLTYQRLSKKAEDKTFGRSSYKFVMEY